MSAPNIILQTGQILLSPSTSRSGIVIVTLGYVYGSIEAAYNTSDYSTIGSTVLFSLHDAIEILYGSTQYFVLSEKEIIYKEP